MATFKHVAGVGKVEMAPEEAAAWLAESKANEPGNRPPEPDPDPVEKLTAFLRANPDIRKLIDEAA